MMKKRRKRRKRARQIEVPVSTINNVLQRSPRQPDARQRVADGTKKQTNNLHRSGLIVWNKHGVGKTSQETEKGECRQGVDGV
jgi:hypothetical protein